MDNRTDAHRALVAAFIETVWNAGAIDRFTDFAAPDYEERAYTPASAEGHCNMVGVLKRVMPDARWSIESMAADGERVICELVLTGTHLGAFKGCEPHGNTIRVRAFRNFRVAKGRIVAHSALLDTTELIRQMQAA